MSVNMEVQDIRAIIITQVVVFYILLDFLPLKSPDYFSSTRNQKYFCGLRNIFMFCVFQD